MAHEKVFGFSVSVVRIAAVFYALMLVYGTLFPFRGWEISHAWVENFLIADINRLSKTDLITNILVFLPFGFLCGSLVGRHRRAVFTLAWVGLLGFGLSFFLEFAQAFLPARTSALSDLVLNSGGAVAGAGLALFFGGRWAWGGQLGALRREKFASGTLANIGLLTLVFWSLSQLSPLVPSLGVSILRHGLKPIWYTVSGQTPFVPTQALVYFLSVFALGCLLLSFAESRRFALLFFAMGVAVVLALKVPVLSQQLSLEALLGSGAGLVLLGVFFKCSARALLAWAGIFLVAAFVIESLRPGSSSEYYSFNWVPFKGHMRNLVGLAAILWSSWVFLGVGFVARSLSPVKYRLPVILFGGLGVFFLALAVELQQQTIPGRSPDVTDVIIAMGAWTLAWVGSKSDTRCGDG